MTDDDKKQLLSDDYQFVLNGSLGAYQPIMDEEIKGNACPEGIPDEVIEGKIDCNEGEEDAAAIFERLLTLETAPALLGREAFAAHSRDPFFRFCRCWCLCAIRFGCCLARARSLLDVLRC